MNIEIDWRWLAVQVHGEASQYSVPVDAHFRKWYGKPAVYRWLIRNLHRHVIRTYYGECLNLANRLQAYLRPSAGNGTTKGQESNLRSKETFEHDIANGHTVALELLEFRPFSINGRTFQQDDLSSQFVRSSRPDSRKEQG